MSTSVPDILSREAREKAFLSIVKPFQQEYQEMKTLLLAQHKLVPFTFDKAMKAMFSDDTAERNYMVHRWCMEKVYSQENLTSPTTDLRLDPRLSGEAVLDPNSGFPYRFTHGGGPVPIHFGSNYVVPKVTMAPNGSCLEVCDFKWNYNSYRDALLAIDAIDHHPRLPLAAYQIAQDPAFLEGRDVVTCAEMFPSLFKNRRTEDRLSEGTIFASANCDVHTLIMSYIHIARAGVSNPQGDLTRRTLERYMFAVLVNTLNYDRFAYEDFWVTIGRVACMGPGCWDMGEGWASQKLGEPEEVSLHYYTSAKASNIARLAEQFMRERAEIMRKPKRFEDRAGEIVDVSWEDIMGPVNKKKQRPFVFTKLHKSHSPKIKDIDRKGANIATPKSHLPPGVTDANQGRIMLATKKEDHSQMVLRVPIPSSVPSMPPMSPGTGQARANTAVTSAAASAALPAPSQRFFQEAIFEKVLPSLRPHLNRGDLARLARVNSDVGAVSVKALYRGTTLRVSSDPKDLQILSFVSTTTSRPGISKKEALTHLGAIHLVRPNLAMIQVLLDIRFLRLKQLSISNQYLIDILLQSHAMRATLGVPYTSFGNPATSFDFVEAQLIRYLLSYTSVVDISVHTSTIGYTDSERSPGYFDAVAARLGISHALITLPCSPYHEAIHWNNLLLSPPLAGANHTWWAVPDLGTRLSLDQVSPIDTLILRITSATTNFLGLSARNLVVILGIEALYEDEPDLMEPEEVNATTVSTLAFIQSILNTRLVETTSVSVCLPNPPDSAMALHIQALHPGMVMGTTDEDGKIVIQWLVDKFLRLASSTEINTMCDLTRASYLVTVTNILSAHHATTPLEVADFQRIKFGYQEAGPWRHSRIIPERLQMEMEQLTEKYVIQDRV